ncbi:UPF0585 protein C16orf13 homolog A-like [Sinocyclocheilus grahami]|uniref:UPF0585 protein C16orf13 homolog A-like n=1 Tax=Sinocyclocheilus grahami TaxID=75366 RepID=UPI0007ACDC9C|nr:PREDICTED: UPF0585 protein C16orf13 homolog A-like [Sinocyclocheilus grahami]
MRLFWAFAQFRKCLGSPYFAACKGTCRRMCKMLNAAAADRNKDPILAVLKSRVASDRPLVALEISSGTGQHVIHFAKAFPNISWQPSEIEAQSISREFSYNFTLYIILFLTNLFYRNPEWGLRDVSLLKTLGQENGLRLEEIVDMPANNKCLLFHKDSVV